MGNGSVRLLDKAYLEENGYNVCYGLGEFNAEVETAEKMVLCQFSAKGKDADNYVSDAEYEQNLGLADMLKAGMTFLGDDKPFFFMCEGGRIDWEAHANNLMPMIKEILDFDRTVGAVLEWAARDGETLVIVTADHSTGGMTLLGGKVAEQSVAVNYANTGHNGVALPVYAWGPGAEKFVGIYENAELSQMIKEILK